MRAGAVAGSSASAPGPGRARGDAAHRPRAPGGRVRCALRGARFSGGDPAHRASAQPMAVLEGEHLAERRLASRSQEDRRPRHSLVRQEVRQRILSPYRHDPPVGLRRGRAARLLHHDLGPVLQASRSRRRLTAGRRRPPRRRGRLGGKTGTARATSSWPARTPWWSSCATGGLRRLLAWPRSNASCATRSSTTSGTKMAARRTTSCSTRSIAPGRSGAPPSGRASGPSSRVCRAGAEPQLLDCATCFKKK